MFGGAWKRGHPLKLASVYYQICLMMEKCLVRNTGVVARSQVPPKYDQKYGQCKEEEKLATDGWSLRHLRGDLFSCPAGESLAHCISQDCRMGAGIAVLFRKKFHGVEELKKQHKLPGQCAVLERSGRYIYYLITKEKYFHKPTYDTLRQSLQAMKVHCLSNGVTHVSMPRIGCGLDRLKWEKVSEILEEVFWQTDIQITIYSL
ncbi:ADP-ribose glycohydrolase OARD1 isoform X2 [Chanos chanos]|uniref:ADP-ribose glycohydrolase OARD1 isoform X2 n=1 Tax=Chanos chanos TaxID=29144 RepID=A0A6J2UVC6_CHACN|nr:ADP-ribose glycohydrolase OARD1-like isoform X2 [Chanos chanos]